MRLLLASSSPYRRALLERLTIPFETTSPEIDETPKSGESGQALAQRLALEKAKAGANMVEAGVIVIGSDQVAEAEGQKLGKPLTTDRAVEQLLFLSGKTITFHTAVSCLQGNRHLDAYVPTQMTLRDLSLEEVERYVALDQPLDCSGALKTESLGISLMKSFESKDPTAIIGLPLIAVCQALRQFGLDVP